ncbi:MAG: hypothetical protein AAGD14_09320 [Planctomycetota bacterium]
MRKALVMLLLAGPLAADEADEYFEIGLGYLKTGFYAEARAAFSESLVRAPGQAVPTAFAGIACAGEGRDSRTCAYLLRLAYQRLPAKRSLRLDLNKQLRSARDLERIAARFRQRLKDARGAARVDNLTVLAFLEVQDGTPGGSKALAELQKLRPNDAYAKALGRLAEPKKKVKEPKKAPKAKS